MRILESYVLSYSAYTDAGIKCMRKSHLLLQSALMHAFHMDMFVSKSALSDQTFSVVFTAAQERIVHSHASNSCMSVVIGISESLFVMFCIS